MLLFPTVHNSCNNTKNKLPVERMAKTPEEQWAWKTPSYFMFILQQRYAITLSKFYSYYTGCIFILLGMWQEGERTEFSPLFLIWRSSRAPPFFPQLFFTFHSRKLAKESVKPQASVCCPAQLRMKLEKSSHVHWGTPVPPHLDMFHLAPSTHQWGSCSDELKSFTGQEELQKLYTKLQNHSFISIKQGWS